MGGCAGQWLGVAFQLLQLAGQRGVAGQAERMYARQQSVQDDTQLPDVGGGGDGRVVQLFRRGIFEGQCAVMGGGDVGAFQLLGDAEVEQLDPSVCIHQQIGGLEVPVHDQVAMRVAHRIEDLQEQPDALAQSKAARIAPTINGLACDELHHEVRFAIRADAAIQQGGDIRMLQASQDLPFAQETLARGG